MKDFTAKRSKILTYQNTCMYMYFNFDINAYTYNFKIQKNDIKKN